jgi:hypothetical protein
MRDGTDDAPARGRPAWVGKLLAPVVVAGHLLFYDALPAILTWVVGAAEGLDLFAGFDAPAVHRLAGLGTFLSAVAAIVTTESVTWVARPFRVGHYLMTVVVLGVALFPTLADWHRLRPGLTPDQFAIVQAYCYLTLKVAFGVLVGATVSWILLACHHPLSYTPRPQYSRK